MIIALIYNAVLDNCLASFNSNGWRKETITRFCTSYRFHSNEIIVSNVKCYWSGKCINGKQCRWRWWEKWHQFPRKQIHASMVCDIVMVSNFTWCYIKSQWKSICRCRCRCMSITIYSNVWFSGNYAKHIELINVLQFTIIIIIIRSFCTVSLGNSINKYHLCNGWMLSFDINLVPLWSNRNEVKSSVCGNREVKTIGHFCYSIEESRFHLIVNLFVVGFYL